jgi:heterotetrameric sarcosine oxidase gamma subunit
VTLEFLSPISEGAATAATPLAESPLEAWLGEAGARFEGRHGWRVPMDFGSPAEEEQACRTGVGIADRTAMGKFEIQGRPEALADVLEVLLADGSPESGQTARLEGALLWRSSPDRALAVCDPAATDRLRGLLRGACQGSQNCGLVEMTAGFAAIELRGPLTRELLERLTAIDVREAGLPLGGVRGGMVAQVSAVLLCLEPEAFLILVGAPEAPDAWEIALDAGAPLGLRPVGEGARALARQRAEGEPAHA